MIEKFISPGDKVEMKSTVEVVLPDGTKGIRLYKTSVFDVLDDGRLEIVMPMEQAKLVLLPVGGEYDVCFFSHGGMYRADVRIVDRQKVNGTYIIVAEMTTNLHKYQRREYYRFNCIIDMSARPMTPKEVEAYSKEEYEDIEEEPMTRGVIVDISGGGLRFVSRQQYVSDSAILLTFTLPVGAIKKTFLLAAKVIFSRPIENRTEEYENRVKYIYITSPTREEIIKYIFDEERKNRKYSRMLEDTE